MVPDENVTQSYEGHPTQQTLCNEDHLSDYSESSLSVTSPVISDDDGDDGWASGLDESETGSDEDLEEPEGDPNRGQNLRFRLQAAAAGRKCLISSRLKARHLTG